MTDAKKPYTITLRQPPHDGPTDERALGSRTSVEWADEESSTRLTDATVTMPVHVQPRGGRTRALLTMIAGPNAGRAFSVRDGETILGRGKEAHVRVDDAGASRAHARIVVSEDEQYILEDLGSTNGTFVQGVRIERVDLHSGDRVHVGPNVVLSFAVLDSQVEMITHQLYESAMRDMLTRAHNRRYLLERLGSELAYARRHGTRLGLLMFDIDHFKGINDTHGHLAGDEVLREVAAMVSRLIRTEDVFARYGGEEFVVLARGIEYENAGRFAERIRAAIERLEIPGDSVVLRVTVSVGFALLDELPEADQTAAGLFGLTDERLYRAKSTGRNRVCGK
ncbi:MAG: GGDEF domain-containing protein [Polyangiaceae bacterium]|jgi:diguanylate cyclase (GGDEF)-like protein